ncbi:MAG: HPr(Ser) kinase/phosphatase [Myxococcales bacterium]|nr:HPr(Ser) kinase/phosphatase [Myxococcales bacterium]
MSAITVREILEHRRIDLSLDLLTSEAGLDNKIRTPYVQKSGLAMTGYVSFVARNRVQLFGQTEMSYLAGLPAEDQERVCEKYFDQHVACCIISRDLPVPPIFLAHAERTQTPVLRTALPTQALIERLTKLLEAHFAKSASLHGVLLDTFGVGVLLLGDSGIGKSECAIDLIARGHRLVADDTVELVRQGPTAIYGRGPEIIKYHMEIRGLGIINIKELFGISAIRDRKKVQLVVKLVTWEKDIDYDRIGLDDKKYTILGVELPLIVLPVRPGRNLSTIIEVAARNQLLKLEGYNAAKEFQQQLLSKLSQEAGLPGEETE